MDCRLARTMGRRPRAVFASDLAIRRGQGSIVPCGGDRPPRARKACAIGSAAPGGLAPPDQAIAPAQGLWKGSGQYVGGD